MSKRGRLWRNRKRLGPAFVRIHVDGTACQGNDCKHLATHIYNGTPVCTECALAVAEVTKQLQEDDNWRHVIYGVSYEISEDELANRG